jgi:hypothetical protein
MLTKLRRFYTATAILALNSLLLFVGLNAILTVVFRYWDDPGKRAIPARDFLIADADRARSLYPQFSDSDYRVLVREWSFLPLVYDPFTEFKERPCHGRFLNVEAAGYRRIKDQAPWPPPPDAIPVFVFGGSTTFGYPIPDEDTIPSYLQQALRASHPKVAVYNFGRGFYFSSQERALFEKLLVDGHRPAIAVFIDGLNEFSNPTGNPFLTPKITQMVADRNEDLAGFRIAGLDKLPLCRLVNGFLWRIQHHRPSAAVVDATLDRVPLAPPRPAAPSPVNRILERYLANKALITALAHVHGVTPVFLWQPIATYRYDLSRHISPESNFSDLKNHSVGYHVMKARLQSGTVKDLVWLADIQRGLSFPLYVDRVHYSPAFCRFLAGTIATALEHPLTARN